MKNLFKIIILAILTSIVISSCKQVSVIKRKYNKGYYVSHSHKHPEVKSESSTTSSVLKKPEYLKPIAITSLRLPNSTTPVKEYVPTASVVTPLKTVGTYHPANEMKNLMSSRNSFKEVSLMPVKLFSNGTIKNLTASHEGHDALSLLWIIIVIILIVWLLGFLFDGFGIGWGIHLLAVIALILLILWLLRII